MSKKSNKTDDRSSDHKIEKSVDLNIGDSKNRIDWSTSIEERGYKPTEDRPSGQPPQDSGTGATTNDSE